MSKQIAPDNPEPSPADNDLSRLLNWLGETREEAALEYLRWCEVLIEYFRHRGCLTPEELSDQTFDRIGRNLSRGVIIKAEKPGTYIYPVARNVLREYWRSKDRARASLEDIPEDEHYLKMADADKDQETRELRITCLRECLERLPAENHDLLIEYYRGDYKTQAKNRKLLAKKHGITDVNLRSRILRLREKLARCVRACSDRKENNRNTPH